MSASLAPLRVCLASFAVVVCATPAAAGGAAPGPAAALERAGAVLPAAIKSSRALATGALGPRSPRFDPTGERLVFVGGPADAGDLYVVGRDGSGLTRLTTDPADDRGPTFCGDGRRIVFSSNRGGSYDLWTLDLAGPPPLEAQRLTSFEGEEGEATVSPLRYSFYAVRADGCSDDGASGERLESYDKVVFTRRWEGRREVWFSSLDGRHTGRISPPGGSCHSPRYSGDGLGLTWACEAQAGSVLYDSRAEWDQSFAAALTAVGFSEIPYDEPDESYTGPAYCESETEGAWRDDKCLGRLPRRYARHAGRAASVAAQRLRSPSFSANQTLLVAAGPPADGALHFRWRGAEAPWGAVALSAEGGAQQPVWAPDGRALVYIAGAPGGPTELRLATTDFYLQQVRDLVDYPELWGAGASQRLHANSFVARPGQEKEFFTLYEKLAYRRRAPFVTTDAALQVFHDEFAGMLRSAERDAQAVLLELTETLYDVAVADLERGTPAARRRARYLAVYFGVPLVLLRAANEVQVPDPDDRPPEEPGEAGPPPVAQIAAALPKRIQDLEPSLRAEANRHLQQLLAHEGFVKVAYPGAKQPEPVDYSLFQVRGHYGSSALAGYFLAMTWYAVLPLPLDRQSFAWLDAGEALQLWQRIDTLVGAFMGRPVDLTLSHLRRLREEHPGLLKPGASFAPVLTHLAGMLGPLQVRGAEGALGAGPRTLRLRLFPRRVGLDTEVFKQLTHPDVKLRGWPSALDVYAALGSDTAATHAAAAERGSVWFDAYQAALQALQSKAPGRLQTLASTDLYHAWLALLVGLARPLDPAVGRRLAFAASPAWQDRKLLSALAGYAQLKHDAILYAFQDYSAECDSGRPVVVFVELPELPEPRGFVDPEPELFVGLAALAGRAYQALAGGQAPAVHDPWAEDPAAEALNGRTFALRLAKLASAARAGEDLGAADHEWLRAVGRTLESLFLGQPRPRSVGYTGDEGRLERGVSLVADVHSNVTSAEALHEAVGQLLDLYVAVPDRVGQRLTQGGLYSFYELRVPMAERLTDEAWWERVKAGRLPPPPPFSASFLEPRP